MIDLVLPESRLGFAAALMEMHHDRKQVFVDRFGWSLPAKGSWLEIDQFDDDYAVYLLARSPEGRHRGSVRLLPSSRPHMLNTLFSHLCPGGVPGGDDCWEISRLVTSPADAAGTTMLRIHRLLARARRGEPRPCLYARPGCGARAARARCEFSAPGGDRKSPKGVSRECLGTRRAGAGVP